MRFESEVTITPSMAKQMLEKNRDNNRKPKTAKVSAYARDIKAGRWQMTGEAIKFDTNGHLMDGQNRLMAVIEADTPAVFSVFYDLAPETMLVMDTGAARSFGDALGVAYGTPNKYNVQSVVRWVLGAERTIWRGTGGGFNPTFSEMAIRYDADALLFDAAAARGRDAMQAGFGVASAAGTAYYLFHRIDAETAKQFFDDLISGANLVPKQPVLTLRNRLTRTRYDGLTRQDQLALYIRAWNATREGRELANIVVSPTGNLTNENFPRPK